MSTCDCCFKELPVGSKKKYCSDACKMKMYRKSKTTATVCSSVSCNNKFIPTRKGQFFCSVECKNAAKKNQQTREVMNLTFRVTESYYSKRPGLERIEFIVSTLKHAYNDNNYRMMLTNPKMLKPDFENSSLFWRKDASNYKTFPEIVNTFCVSQYCMDVSRLLKEQPDILDKIDTSVDTRLYDQRGFWRNPNGPEPGYTLEQLDEVMSERPTWLRDYVKSIYAIRLA